MKIVKRKLETIQCAIEKRSSRKPHKLEIGGSTPSGAISLDSKTKKEVMSKADVIIVLEKISKEKCSCCKGKGCKECFNTGKRLVTARELSEKLKIALATADRNLRKLFEQKEVERYLTVKETCADPPVLYKWKIKN